MKRTEAQKAKYNEYMRKWYENKIKTDPEWKNKKRAQTKKSVDKFYKKTGYVNSTQKKYYEKNKHNEGFLNKNRRLKLIYYYANLEKAMLCKAKQRANTYKLDFNIDIDDIKIPEICPVFGIRFIKSPNHATIFSASLDRIIPEKGYTKNNVQVISLLANKMKSNATPEQLLKFADWVYKTYKEAI